MRDTLWRLTGRPPLLMSVGCILIASAVFVTVALARDTATAARRTVAPRLLAFLPSSGAPGSTVSLLGRGLANTKRVTFNGTPAAFTLKGSTRIAATVPASATSGPLGVTTSAGSTTSIGNFTVLAPSQQAPTINGLAPDYGLPGHTITITGTNLFSTLVVAFNGARARFAVTNDHTLTATIPAGAVDGPITVFTHGGVATSADGFTVAMMISRISPSTGAPGSPVSITGSGLGGATGVEFNGTVANVFRIDSPRQITVIVPAGATAGAVTVSRASHSASSSTVFTPLDLPEGSFDVSNTTDAVNGDCTSLPALVANPGIDGISLREALLAANSTAPGSMITISFEPALTGSTIKLDGTSPGLPAISRDNLTLEAPTVDGAHPGITLDASNVTQSRWTLTVHASHVAVSHFSFTNVVSRNDAMSVQAGALMGGFASAPAAVSDVAITGNNFENAPAQGTATGITIREDPTASNALVSGVTVADNTFSGYAGDGDSIKVQIAGSSDTISDVTIVKNAFQSTTLPVELVACCGGTSNRLLNTHVYSNTFVDAHQPLSMLAIGDASGTTSDNTIDGTTVWGNTFIGNSAPELNATAGIDNASGNVISNTLVSDNLIVGGDGVFVVGATGLGSTGNQVENFALTNDTFAHSTHGLYVAANDGGSGNSVADITATNDIFDDAGWSVTSDGVATASVKYSLFWNGCDHNNFPDPTDLCADPLFADTAQGDYRLQEGSPAIDAATSDNAPTVDLTCMQRYDDPSTVNTGGGAVPYYDIGAFEFGGAPGTCPS